MHENETCRQYNMKIRLDHITLWSYDFGNRLSQYYLYLILGFVVQKTVNRNPGLNNKQCLNLAGLKVQTILFECYRKKIKVWSRTEISWKSLRDCMWLLSKVFGNPDQFNLSLNNLPLECNLENSVASKYCNNLYKIQMSQQGSNCHCEKKNWPFWRWAFVRENRICHY